MWTTKLKHTAVIALLTSVAAKKSTSIHLPRSKLCSTAFKKDVAFCPTNHSTNGDISNVVSNVISDIVPRGGDDGEIWLAVRLKVGGYFALWYILNIVYNSECII
jgi:hypothetical protein